jgi:hypothetical protein
VSELRGSADQPGKRPADGTGDQAGGAAGTGDRTGGPERTRSWNDVRAEAPGLG